MLVTKIQRFSTHDGPGIRTVVFLSGCPLSCLWCHNPEARLYRRVTMYTDTLCMGCGGCGAVCPSRAHDFSGGHIFDREKCVGCFACTQACPTGALTVSASDMTAEEIIRVVKRDTDFYYSPDPSKLGGLTLSGGEPLANPDNALSLLRLAKENGISTAVETSGHFDSAVLSELIPLVDVFLWDFKDGDDARHISNTGVSAKRSLGNLLAVRGTRVILRCIMIHGVNMDEANLSGIASAYHDSAAEAVELLPYHPYGQSKYEQLGLDGMTDANYIPPTDALNAFREKLLSRGVLVLPLR